MDYRIEKLDAFKVVCRRKTVKKSAEDGPAWEISDFWDECTKDGSIKKLVGCFPKEPRLKGLLGICYSEDTEGLKFPYGIGVEYDGRPVEEGFEIVEIPAHTYAVFPCRGKMPEAFAETYRKIVTEFFPQSDRYEYEQGVELEVYPSDKVDDPQYFCEIWVAVREKAPKEDLTA